MEEENKRCLGVILVENPGYGSARSDIVEDELRSRLNAGFDVHVMGNVTRPRVTPLFIGFATDYKHKNHLLAVILFNGSKKGTSSSESKVRYQLAEIPYSSPTLIEALDPKDRSEYLEFQNTIAALIHAKVELGLPWEQVDTLMISVLRDVVDEFQDRLYVQDDPELQLRRRTLILVYLEKKYNSLSRQHKEQDEGGQVMDVDNDDDEDVEIDQPQDSRIVRGRNLRAKRANTGRGGTPSQNTPRASKYNSWSRQHKSEKDGGEQVIDIDDDEDEDEDVETVQPQDSRVVGARNLQAKIANAGRGRTYPSQNTPSASKIVRLSVDRLPKSVYLKRALANCRLSQHEAAFAAFARAGFDDNKIRGLNTQMPAEQLAIILKNLTQIPINIAEFISIAQALLNIVSEL
ncbi:hypothetical protein C8J56DRAFT_889788 [Mycena floridula]|nr:hypothetical protein C8J56DRAFT_889788 [Mycena floridula]